MSVKTSHTQVNHFEVAQLIPRFHAYFLFTHQIDRIAESGQFSLVGGRVFSSLSELIKYYHEKQHHPLPCAIAALSSYVMKYSNKEVFHIFFARSLDSIIATSIETVQVIKQTAFNGINPDHETLLSAARTIYQGLVQQVTATGISVVPVSHPSGSEFNGKSHKFLN